MKLRYPEMKDSFDHDGFRRGQQREEAQAEREKAERYERKLLREIEAEDAKRSVDPPRSSHRRNVRSVNSRNGSTAWRARSRPSG